MMTATINLPGRPILILGMHRSGTSCLAGSLQAAGLHLGEVRTWNKDNEKGNRENRAIMDLNDEVLAANGGSWHHPPKEASWAEALKAKRRAALASIACDGPWGFKDPRSLLTLKGWLEALGEVELVGSFRRPGPVVASLAKRPVRDPRDMKAPPSSFPRAHWFRLWRRHNRKLLALARVGRARLVCFDWPRPVYLEAVTRLAAELRLPEPAASGEFFASELRHHSGDDGEEDAPEDLAEIYAELGSLAIRARPASRECSPMLSLSPKKRGVD